MKSPAQFVRKENIEVYCYLYIIETSLRELIIEALERVAGRTWYKQRLPAPALEKYRNSVESEKKIKWSQSTPYHPMYYIDFPHLKDIITRRDNWNDAFKDLFSREDIFSGMMSELEPVRNRVAHNRGVNEVDVKTVISTYSKIAQCIGEENINRLTSKCTDEPDLVHILTSLEQEAREALNICISSRSLPILVVWNKVKQKWWFDDSYLGSKVDDINLYFQALEDYGKIPRLRGTGHKIEEWVITKGMESLYNKSKSDLDAILSGWR